MSEPALRVTVEDLLTGDVETVEVPMHDYLILVTGDAHLDIQTHANGTHQLTDRKSVV